MSIFKKAKTVKAGFYAGPYDGTEVEIHEMPGKGDMAVGASMDGKWEHVYHWSLKQLQFLYDGAYKRGSCTRNVIVRLGYKVFGKGHDLHEGGVIQPVEAT